MAEHGLPWRLGIYMNVYTSYFRVPLVVFDNAYAFSSACMFFGCSPERDILFVCVWQEHFPILTNSLIFFVGQLALSFVSF